MTSSLKFGASASLKLDFPADALVVDCAAPAGMDDAQTVALAQAATQSPLDFPPLRQATVPGDHIVIALGPAVPQAPDVVAAIVPELMSGGAAPEDITILCEHTSSQTAAPDPRRQLPQEVRDAVRLVTHDPAHQESLSYLAADAQGAPIYLNRLLCDADLVVPVGCLRVEHSEKQNGRHPGIWNDTLYPTFSDRSTLDHLAPNGVPLSVGQSAHRHRAVDQVAWLLGVQITAQVIPASGDSALSILAGAPEAVFREGESHCRSAWQRQVPQRASLVVAGIGGGKWSQTWSNVGRALEAAMRVVSDDGAIVLCTELEEPLGPALKLLAQSADHESIHNRLKKMRSADAPLARLLADSLDHTTIYLLSKLPEEIVSSVGFAYVADPHEISRLATHHESCVLLPDAQYAWPTVAGEE